MYIVLLSYRYLRNSRLTLLSSISVGLGVATLIVINSVIGGFSMNLRERLHRAHADVLLEGITPGGLIDPQGKMEQIRQDPVLRNKILRMTATLETLGMLQFEFQGTPTVQPVRVVGVDPDESPGVGILIDHLLRPRDETTSVFQYDEAGQRRYACKWTGAPVREDIMGSDQFQTPRPGAIVGYTIGHYRNRNPADPLLYTDVQLLSPGAEVLLMTVRGETIEPVSARFVVCDYFRSELTEFDDNYILVSLPDLQRMLGMEG